MRLRIVLLLLHSALGWRIVKNSTDSELVPGVSQPRFAVQWIGDAENFAERLQVSAALSF